MLMVAGESGPAGHTVVLRNSQQGRDFAIILTLKTKEESALEKVWGQKHVLSK